MLTLKNIEYKASIIGILIMLALKNIKYKASIIGILMMLGLKNTNYKASIIGILMMVALESLWKAERSSEEAFIIFFGTFHGVFIL